MTTIDDEAANGGSQLHAADDEEFSATYSEGIGRRVLTLESANAHIDLAEEWAAAGKP